MRYADNLAKRQEHSIGHICLPCCRTRRHQGERLCSVVLFYPQRRRGIEWSPRRCWLRKFSPPNIWCWGSEVSLCPLLKIGHSSGCGRDGSTLAGLSALVQWWIGGRVRSFDRSEQALETGLFVIASGEFATTAVQFPATGAAESVHQIYYRMLHQSRSGSAGPLIALQLMPCDLAAIDMQDFTSDEVRIL